MSGQSDKSSTKEDKEKKDEDKQKDKQKQDDKQKDKEKGKQQQQQQQADVLQKLVLDQVEEDDEFEEFEQEDWTVNDDLTEAQQWQEDWDDEVEDDDFIRSLRQELQGRA